MHMADRCIRSRPLRPRRNRPVTKESQNPKRGKRKCAGVIRLLEEGHFKGVADVRLRINFYEELSARAAASGTQAAETGTADLIGDVSAKAQELIAGWGLDEESQAAANDLLAQFESAAQTVLSESTTNGVVDMTGLADALRTAFDSLSQQLAALAPPPVEVVEPVVEETEDPTTTEPTDTSATETPVDPVVDETENSTVTEPTDLNATETPVEPVVQEESADAGLPESGVEVDTTDATTVPNPDIELLTQFFTDAIDKLLASVAEASQLPPLTSEPMGNGKAYDKFVAIYNQLTGQTPAEETPADDAGETVEDQVDEVV